MKKLGDGIKDSGDGLRGKHQSKSYISFTEGAKATAGGTEDSSILKEPHDIIIGGRKALRYFRPNKHGAFRTQGL